jgi:hypothetical protein
MLELEVYIAVQLQEQAGYVFINLLIVAINGNRPKTSDTFQFLWCCSNDHIEQVRVGLGRTSRCSS